MIKESTGCSTDIRDGLPSDAKAGWIVYRVRAVFAFHSWHGMACIWWCVFALYGTAVYGTQRVSTLIWNCVLHLSSPTLCMADICHCLASHLKNK